MEYSSYVSTSGRTVRHRALLVQAFIFVLTTSRMPLILVATDLFADYLAMYTLVCNEQQMTAYKHILSQWLTTNTKLSSSLKHSLQARIYFPAS